LFATGPRAVTWASWALNLDPAHQSHLTLAAAPPLPLGIFAAAPFPYPFSWTPPPSPIFFLLKPLQPSPPKTLAAPPPHFSSPPPPRCSPPSWFSVVWLQSQLEFGGRKKEGGREESKVNLCLIFFVFVLQSIGLCVYLCESVELLSRNFVSGWTAVVLGISGNFHGLN
jgi:hypothetical protein